MLDFNYQTDHKTKANRVRCDMKKSVITVIAAFIMGLTMTACGSGEPAEAPSVADSDKAAVQEKLTEGENGLMIAVRCVLNDGRRIR